MATLASGNLSFDFRYTNFNEAGWIDYQFYFCWKNESIINDSILKRDGEYWGNRPLGAFLANEYENDGLTLLIKEILENDKADYWEALEPDIIIAIYPEQFFPFLPSHLILIRESDEHKTKRAEREKLKKEKGKLPDDCYTFTAFVDAYNFKESDGYYGQGLSLQMLVTRNDLEQFLSDLETEYSEFKTQFKIAEWLEENH